MKKIIRKALSMLLVAIMVFTVIPLTGTYLEASAAAKYMWPVVGNYSVSRWNNSVHHGVDITNSGNVQNPQIISTYSGTVTQVSNVCPCTGKNYPYYDAKGDYVGMVTCLDHRDTYGNLVKVLNDDGTTSVYGHLKYDSICVKVGDRVSQGQVLGLMGDSGVSTGIHLHFEIRTGSKQSSCIDLKNTSFLPANTNPYVNLGDDFYAVILNTNYWKPITYNSKDENKSVTLTNAITTSEQLWRFIRQNDGSYVIYSAANGNVMEMDCGRTTSGNPVIAQEYWAGEYQKWFIYNHNNGYIIQSKHYYDMNLVLTLDNNNSADGTRITTAPRNDSSSQFWSIYSQDDVQLKSPILSVTVGDSSEDTVFTWNDGCGESHYNLRIWQDGVNSGIEYHTEWMASSGAGIQLPAGTYQAYVDAVNHYQCIASNFVTFTVADKYYSVSYDANGGSSVPAMQNKPYGKDIILDSATPTRTNYNFIGWNTKADGTGATYQPGDTYTENADVTLYAIWELAHTHSYTSSVTKQPTCTEKGIRKYTCSSCGDTYTEDIAALGHNHIGSVTEPTCTEYGFTTYTCTRCDNSYNTSFTDPLNHPTSSWYTAVNPTASSDGLAEKRCDHCGKVLEQFIIPSLVPDYVTGVSLSSEKETVKVGSAFTLKATVTPDTAKNKNVIWSSRNPEIATVVNGKVTAVKPGTTAIVATTEDGGYVAFCLVRVLSLSAINGAVINNDSNIVSGLSCNLNSVDNYLELADGNMSIVLSDSVVGTGTTISVTENGEVVDSYTAVIFGDIDGNGLYDADDAFIVNMINAGLISADSLSVAERTAADCNHDGKIDKTDFELLLQASVLLDEIKQSSDNGDITTSALYIDYCSVISQSAEFDAETESGNESDTAGSDDGAYAFDFVAFFRSILDLLSKIFSFIISLF